MMPVSPGKGSSSHVLQSEIGDAIHAAFRPFLDKTSSDLQFPEYLPLIESHVQGFLRADWDILVGIYTGASTPGKWDEYLLKAEQVRFFAVIDSGENISFWKNFVFMEK